MNKKLLGPIVAALVAFGVMVVPVAMADPYSQFCDLRVAGTTTSNFSCNSIPHGVDAGEVLEVWGMARSHFNPGNCNSNPNLNIYFNGDTGANYSESVDLGGTVDERFSQHQLWRAFVLPNDSSCDDSGAWLQFHLTVQDYGVSISTKQVQEDSVGAYLPMSSGVGSLHRYTGGGHWDSTAAIYQINFTTSDGSYFTVGSQAQVWIH